MPEWLWDSEPLRHALARVDLSGAVAIVRTAAGVSQKQLGNLVPGWSQSMVSMIESGRRGTLYDIRELLRFADTIDMPRKALLPVVLGDADATLGGDSVDLPGVKMRRRDLYRLTGVC